MSNSAQHSRVSYQGFVDLLGRIAIRHMGVYCKVRGSAERSRHPKARSEAIDQDLTRAKGRVEARHTGASVESETYRVAPPRHASVRRAPHAPQEQGSDTPKSRLQVLFDIMNCAEGREKLMQDVTSTCSRPVLTKGFQLGTS